MNSPDWLPQDSYPRAQAERIARLITQEGNSLRAALLGRRREGKTDLLRQIHALLFDKAEGPIPFFYSFAAGRDDGFLARHFLAAFCQQVRAFLMRQGEMLWEPAAGLERELERAGLPLSLTELARNVLALPAAEQLEFAASVPAQFVHREGRPLCLLLDDVHVLSATPPTFFALDSPRLCWLLAGRYPFVSRAAEDAAWPVMSVEPFPREEAVALAEQNCKKAALRSTRETWEQWCEMAGPSCALIKSLIAAATLHEQPLESLEELGRVYFRELASGTLGIWLRGSFERAIPDRRDRAMVFQLLAEAAESGSPVSASLLAPRIWDGLAAEEWVEDTAEGARIVLDAVRRDWLRLLAGVPERSEARMLQSFLMRGEQSRERMEAEYSPAAIRQRLLDLPQLGFPEFLPWEDREMAFPRFISICTQTTARAELFWCYGFRGENRSTPENAGLLLIALCKEAPAESEVQGWNRQLESEAGRMVSRHVASPGAGQAAGPSRELWVVVPAGASLVMVASERRLSAETFFRILGLGNGAVKVMPGLRTRPES